MRLPRRKPSSRMQLCYCWALCRTVHQMSPTLPAKTCYKTGLRTGKGGLTHPSVMDRVCSTAVGEREMTQALTNGYLSPSTSTVTGWSASCLCLQILRQTWPNASAILLAQHLTSIAAEWMSLSPAGLLPAKAQLSFGAHSGASRQGGDPLEAEAPSFQDPSAAWGHRLRLRRCRTVHILRQEQPRRSVKRGSGACGGPAACF